MHLRATTHGPNYRPAMAAAARHLYAAGGVLFLGSSPIAALEGGNAPALAVIGGLCAVLALVHLRLGPRVPTRVYPFSTLLGIVAVSLAIHFGGAFGSIYALMYVWAALFSFFFFPRAVAVLETVVLAVAATLVLGPAGNVAVDLAFGVVTFGTAATAGLLTLVAKRRIAELVESASSAERRRRALIERLPLTLYVDRLDDVSSNLYTSPQAEEMFGYAPEDWLDDPDLFVRILHPADRERVLEQHASTRAGGDPLLAEYRVIARDGRVVWVRDHAVVADDDGESCLHGFLVDVSNEKRLEEELRQAQKLEAIGRLAGGIAHDFNNLLTVIGGYLEIASMRAKDAAITDALDEAMSASRRAAELTAQLLAFGRRQVLSIESVDPNDVVARVERLVARVVGEDVTVEFDLESELGSVQVDRGQLEQVLVNLAINARDAMPEGGVLTFATASVDLSPAFCAEHDGLRSGPHVQISVSDTGLGMDEDTLAHVFEPFFTTKEVGKGTGLGLATAYGTIKQSGGAIDVSSEPGRGTTFDVYLPRSAADASLPDVVEPAPERGSETILLVEDEPVVRRLTRRILEEQGYRVVDADGGRAALDAIDAADPPTLVLTDVVMPGMNGREVAQTLRAVVPDLKVLYMSGYPDRIMAAEDTGTFIQKPFTAAALTTAIRRLIDDGVGRAA
jgi:PAS domain S-box-containing protein